MICTPLPLIPLCDPCLKGEKFFHVQQRFHAVGHGTFMTGLLTDRDNTLISWVYDCGSRRTNSREEALDRMHTSGLWSNPIDMLVLSHFDDDHVNGLEALLRLRSIKCLVLPFSDWQQRVRDVCVGGKKGISPSTARLQLDPLGWLQSLKLTERVETLLLVRGGQVAPDSPPFDPISLPINPDPSQGRNSLDPNGVAPVLAELRLGAAGNPSVLQAHEIRHQTPVSIADFPMEFMFYNAELSGTELNTINMVNGAPVARKSKSPLKTVRTEIDQKIVALGLNSSFSNWPSNWRSELKQCYEKHFGSTSHARNNISLCMFASPVSTAIFVERCVLRFENPSETSDHKMVDSFDFRRSGLLCTGDLKLNNAVIAAMKTHFGAVRWKEIGLTQVPHHGSEHSWAAGNAALLAPTTFVHCAPGTPAHPHKNVIKDLLGHQVFTADYKNSVTLQYHFSTL